MNITLADAKRVWSRMQEIYGTTVVNKPSSAFMSIVGGFLKAIGIMDADAFMQHYATTIGTTCYLPYTPGEPESSWSAATQICNCAHEHMHVEYYRDSWTYSFAYVLDRHFRVICEMNCFATALEVSRYFGKLTDNNAFTLSEKLRVYGATNKEVIEAEEYFTDCINLLNSKDLRRKDNWKYLRRPSQRVLTYLTEK